METNTNQPINQTPEQSTPSVQSSPELQTFVKEHKASRLRKLAFAVVAIALVGAGWFGYQSPELFRAAIIEQGAPTGAGNLYIPDYTAGPADEGLLALVADTTAIGGPTDVHSVQFTVEYTPTNALIFNENSIVFDDTTVFQGADLKSVTTTVPGEATFTFFSNAPVTIPAGVNNIAKLGVQIEPTIPTGTVIDMNVTGVDVVEPDATQIFVSSNLFTDITAGNITIASQDELQAFAAVANSNTTIEVFFSDFITNVGVPGDYTVTYEDSGINFLNVTNVELGAAQQSVILTTDPQTLDPLNPAANEPREYTIQVSGNIMSNTQGAPATDYNRVLVHGYVDSSVTSNAFVTTSGVNSSTELGLTFSEAVNAATVTPLNIGIKSVDGGVTEELTITNIEFDSTTQIRIQTEVQEAGRNYFVVFRGVEDTFGNLLGNHTPVQFLGFEAADVVVEQITPATLVSDVDTAFTVFGQSLDQITSVSLGTTDLTITAQSATSLDLEVLAGLEAGVYTLTLRTADNKVITQPNAVVIEEVVEPFTVVTDSSRATPNRVAPGSDTEVTFWVLVQDPVDLNSIDTVTINLEQINGDRAQVMEKDSGTQPQGQQWYVYTTTIDALVATSDEAYLLPVEVRKGNEVATGSVSLFVTKDIIQSVAPVIENIYFSPIAAPPDGTTPIKISAQVTDTDGADTVTSVVANLGPLGAGFIQLERLDVAGTANEQVTAWYSSDEFTIPSTTPAGSYTVDVTATDSTGEVGIATPTLEVSDTIAGPTISLDRSYFSPRQSVPRDEKTPFSIHVYVEDVDGLGDISNVIADFGIIGLPPVALERGAESGDTAKAGFFSAEGLTIPATSPLGVHQVEVIASDKGGNTGNVILQLDVTDEDTIGEAPFIKQDKGYTTPRVAINDGKTPLTLYAFIQDRDDDIESVIVNLSKVGQVGLETPSDFGAVVTDTEATDDPCNSGSKSIVCMKPSLKEGDEGQWFVLPDVTISSSTPPSSEPYLVDVIATDKFGKVGRGSIPVHVNDGVSFTNDVAPPAIQLAVSTSPTTIEVLFSEEMSANTIDDNNFTITNSRDVNDELRVISSTINATGTVVTLTTDTQEGGKQYLVSGSREITDAVGVPLAVGTANRSFFTGYEASTTPPVIEYVAAVSGNTFEVGFKNDIRPSSLTLAPVTGAQEQFRTSPFTSTSFNFEVNESGETSDELAVRGVTLVEPNKVHVHTDLQKSNQKYRIRMTDVESAAGVAPTVGVNKFVIGFNTRAVQQQAVSRSADLNGDGRVDFTDFTIFSAAYGTILEELGVNIEYTGNSDQGLSPINENPDATVPVTSDPTQ